MKDNLTKTDYPSTKIYQRVEKQGKKGSSEIIHTNNPQQTLKAISSLT